MGEPVIREDSLQIEEFLADIENCETFSWGFQEGLLTENCSETIFPGREGSVDPT